MRFRIVLLTAVVLLLAGVAAAQKHEIAFTSGALQTGDHGFEFPRPGILKTSRGLTYQLNYSHRLFNGHLAAIYLEVPLIITPTTKFETDNLVFPRSYSSLFVTPGLKLKLIPGSKWSPYGFAGAGWARLNPSDTRLDNTPSNAKGKTKGAVDYGFGLDVRVFPFVSLRGEVRDIYTATPQFTIDLFQDRQHNFIYSAGVVLRF